MTTTPGKRDKMKDLALVGTTIAGKYRVLNSPSDGHERAVANVLGVTVANGQQTRKSAMRPSGSAN